MIRLNQCQADHGAAGRIITFVCIYAGTFCFALAAVGCAGECFGNGTQDNGGDDVRPAGEDDHQAE